MPGKISLSNWVLGGSLVTVSNDTRARHFRSPRRVVVTEIDSDGNEVERHVLPLSKHKSKKGIKINSDRKLASDTETEEKSKKDPTHVDRSAKGCYCTDCGGKIHESSTKETAVTDTKSKEATKAKETSKDVSKDEVIVEVKDVKANTGVIQPDVRVWTHDQDQIIMKMKGENHSWKDIGAAVGSGKREAQNRHRALRAMQQPTEKLDNKHTSEKEVTSRGGIAELDFSGLFLDDDSGVDGGVSGNDAPFSTLTGYEGYFSGDKKSKKEKKEATKAQNTGSEWYENDSIFRPRSRPANPQLREDAVWSVEDCELLAQLESNYHKTKWLHMQADFFNWTGRMVDAAIIEKKFNDDGFY